MFGKIRRNWFFSNFDRTFLETVQRPLALVLIVDRGPGLLANCVEKSKIRLPVFGVHWVEFGKNANFQGQNANFQTPISPPMGDRSPKFKNVLCYGFMLYTRKETGRVYAHRKRVYPTPKVSHPQICDFLNFDRMFLKTVKSDFAQIFTIDRGP